MKSVASIAGIALASALSASAAPGDSGPALRDPDQDGPIDPYGDARPSAQVRDKVGAPPDRYGAGDAALTAAALGRAAGPGRLPVDLRRSAAAVERRYTHVSNDSVSPLYLAGAGIGESMP